MNRAINLNGGNHVDDPPTTRNHYWASNPAGRNQFPDCREYTSLFWVLFLMGNSLNSAPKTSEEFLVLLREYHKKTTSRAEVKALLSREHGIEVR
jgi:hypothetical protein